MLIDPARFAKLLHAYGAATDAPGHLSALLEGGVDAQRSAVEYLNSAILHQGTPWTATPEVALVVGQILQDARLAGRSNAWLRAKLLAFLGELGEIAADAHDEGDLRADASPPGRDVRKEIEEIVALADPDADGVEVWEAVIEDPVREKAMWAHLLLDCRSACVRLRDSVAAFESDSDPFVAAAAQKAAADLARAAARL